MNVFTIKDLENLSGIKAHTIRIWEQRYNFLKPQRTHTNIRYYSGEELKTILNVSLLNKYGYKISQINKMDGEAMQAKLFALEYEEAQHERTANQMIQAMIDLDMDVFEAVLTAHIARHGNENAISRIIFPFLERIGLLWQTYHINPAQEHLVSNIIRQKLMAGIENMTPPIQSSINALLFMPEGEYHEIGLLYLNYLLKTRGIKVLYLGANVPLNDLEYIVGHKKPAFIFTHLTSVANNFNFEKYLINLHKRIPETPVVVSGALTRHYKKQIPPNIFFKQSLAEVMDYLDSL